MVTIMNNKDYIRVLLYSYYTTTTGWGVLPRYSVFFVFVSSLGLFLRGIGVSGFRAQG